MVELYEKKQWLKWLLANGAFQRREILWILDYLLHHDSILANIKIIEQASKTTRGLVLLPDKSTVDALTLYLEGHQFCDPDQIFHEIRFNWKKPLYLECPIPKAWEHPEFLAVLEDNPYHRWNDSLTDDVFNEVDSFIQSQQRQNERTTLIEKINLAIDAGNREEFKRLSDQLAKLDLKKVISNNK